MLAKRQLNGVEQLEQKQMLTTLVEMPVEESYGPAGDVNGDGAVNHMDIAQMLQSGKYNTGLPATITDGDVNGDGTFSQLDLVQVLTAGKYHQPTFKPGDANLDGVFNQLDIIRLLQQDKYLKDEPADWSSGDFDGDNRFDPHDMVLALQEGDYQVTSNSLLATVPSPTKRQQHRRPTGHCADAPVGQVQHRPAGKPRRG